MNSKTLMSLVPEADDTRVSNFAAFYEELTLTRYCATCGQAVEADAPCQRCIPAVPQGAWSGAAPGFAGAAPGYATPPPAFGNAYGSPGFAPTSAFATPPRSRFSGQWNWGAALLCPFWLMNHNQVPIGITILIVSGVPFLNFLTIPISFFYYGIKGNDIAIASRPFLDDVQFIAVQNAWRNWALSIHLGTYALIVLFVIFAAVLGANTPATKN